MHTYLTISRGETALDAVPVLASKDPGIVNAAIDAALAASKASGHPGPARSAVQPRPGSRSRT